MDKPIPEAVTSLQLMALIDWHGKDGTRKGELTTAALLELHQARLTAAQQQGGGEPYCYVLAGMREIVTGKVNFLCNRERKTDADIPLYTAPPSAPVGVDLSKLQRHVWSSRGWEPDPKGPLVQFKDIEALAQQPAAVDEKYSELLYAVASKYPGESRHETALRYIRQAESADHGDAQAATQHQEPTT